MFHKPLYRMHLGVHRYVLMNNRQSYWSEMSCLTRSHSDFKISPAFRRYFRHQKRIIRHLVLPHRNDMHLYLAPWWSQGFHQRHLNQENKSWIVRFIVYSPSNFISTGLFDALVFSTSTDFLSGWQSNKLHGHPNGHSFWIIFLSLKIHVIWKHWNFLIFLLDTGTDHTVLWTK